jgi:hypothetical protein
LGLKKDRKEKNKSSSSTEEKTKNKVGLSFEVDENLDRKKLINEKQNYQMN